MKLDKIKARLKEAMEQGGEGKKLNRACYHIRQLLAEVERLEKALEWIAIQPCRQEAEGSSEDTDCSETGSCITEWCFPCYAKSFLPESEDE